MAFQEPEFLDADFWERHKARLIGLLVVAAVLIFGKLFYTSYTDGQAESAWSAVVDPETGATVAHVDLAAVEGSAAEPWGLFQNARSAFVEKDLDEADAFASQLQNEHGDHSLVKSGKVDTLLSDIRAEAAWAASHSAEENNPEVSEDKSVTINTSLGPVRIGLYPDESPAAVKAFLELVREGGLAQGSFNEAQRESWIALSPICADKPSDEESDDGADDESENGDEEVETDDENGDEESEAKEPSKLAQGIISDRNSLSHFEGAVSFLRGTAATLDADAKPRIAIYLTDSGYKTDSEVVFGRVMSGLDTLSQASTREVDEGTMLKEPLAVQGIDEGTGLAGIK